MPTEGNLDIKRQLALVGLVVLACAACGGGGVGGSAESHFETLTRTYAEHVVAGDFEAAYSMTSAHLRARMSLDEYVSTHRAAFAELGAPNSYLGFDYNAIGAEELQDNESFPKDVAPENRRARTCATLGTSSGALDLWLDIANDAGKDRIASFELMYAD